MLDLVVAPDPDVCWDAFDVSVFGLCPDFIPVSFFVSLHRLLTKLPRSLDACLLLETVLTCSVVYLYWVPVSMRA